MEIVGNAELKDAFMFLLNKVMDMELKTEEGNDICPMFGYCLCGDDCFLDRVFTEEESKVVAAEGSSEI